MISSTCTMKSITELSQATKSVKPGDLSSQEGGLPENYGDTNLVGNFLVNTHTHTH